MVHHLCVTTPRTIGGVGSICQLRISEPVLPMNPHHVRIQGRGVAFSAREMQGKP